MVQGLGIGGLWSGAGETKPPTGLHTVLGLGLLFLGESNMLQL